MTTTALTLLRQPNGLFAVFSYRRRTFTHLHLTEAMFRSLSVAFGLSPAQADALLSIANQSPAADWANAIADLKDSEGAKVAFETNAICSRPVSPGGLLI